VLVDRFSPRFPRGEGLPPGSADIIRSLGLLEEFCAGGHASSYRNVSVWGKDDVEEKNFIWLPAGEGWHLDVTRFHQSMLRRVESSGVLVVQGSMRISNRTGALFNLSIRRGDGTRELAASCVIDATGRSRTIARQCGVETFRDDTLAAAVGIMPVEAAVEVDASTLVESVLEGWWYANRLPDGRMAVGFMTDADILREKEMRSPNHWLDALSRTVHLQQVLADFRPPERIRVAPAYSSRISQASGPGWIAVGDAAASYDPLSNLGITSALRQGMEAAQVIETEGSVGDYELWVRDQYARYLATLLATYDLERRWDSSFWNRRHQQFEILVR
jgi:flavin-dependent dehydrogenase